MEKIIGLRTLRENIDLFVKQVQMGESFIVARRSKPLFKISPTTHEEHWENVVDFTEIEKGGLSLEDILKRL